jgi:hypothetical protein
VVVLVVVVVVVVVTVVLVVVVTVVVVVVTVVVVVPRNRHEILRWTGVKARKSDIKYFFKYFMTICGNGSIRKVR